MCWCYGHGVPECVETGLFFCIIDQQSKSIQSIVLYIQKECLTFVELWPAINIELYAVHTVRFKWIMSNWNVMCVDAVGMAFQSVWRLHVYIYLVYLTAVRALVSWSCSEKAAGPAARRDPINRSRHSRKRRAAAAALQPIVCHPFIGHSIPISLDVT